MHGMRAVGGGRVACLGPDSRRAPAHADWMMKQQRGVARGSGGPPGQRSEAGPESSLQRVSIKHTSGSVSAEGEREDKGEGLSPRISITRLFSGRPRVCIVASASPALAARATKATGRQQNSAQGSAGHRQRAPPRSESSPVRGRLRTASSQHPANPAASLKHTAAGLARQQSVRVAQAIHCSTWGNSRSRLL